MQTSAGISSELDGAIVRGQRRAAWRQAALLALLLALAALVVSSAITILILTAQASALARCDEARDYAGVGRKSAQRAIEAPERQRRFFYRVAADDEGYRVRLVVKDGEFLGDTWEQDAYGRLRHVHDVCLDRFGDELGERLLARLEPAR